MKMISRVDAAKILHCHPNHIGKLAQCGDLPGTKIGKSWVFAEDDVNSYLLTRIKRDTEHRRLMPSTPSAPPAEAPRGRRGRPRAI
jgi:excisionase family DNA binding protein